MHSETPDPWDAHWDEVGWVEHPGYRDDVGHLRYWNSVDREWGGWKLEAIGRRYRWRNWDLESSGEIDVADDLTAFWMLVAVADPWAVIQEIRSPPVPDEASLVRQMSERFHRLAEQGELLLNGEHWVRGDDGQWRKGTGPGNPQAGTP